MKQITPYRKSSLEKKQQIQQMFDAISKDYDRFNRVISLGMDVKWRENLVIMASESHPKQILDVATGTGDLAIALSSLKPQRIVGIDLSPKMITVGKEKIEAYNLTEKIDLVIGDSEDLPFEDRTFDLITVAFGVRNFENIKKGLSEIHRALKLNGRLIVLETSVPDNMFYKLGYILYSTLILPLIGFLFSKDKSAYRYLSKSASKFPYGEKFNLILKEIGFSNVKNYPQTMGVASIYSAYK